VEATKALTADLPGLIEGMKALLHPKKVTLDTIPERLKAEWVSKDGKARLEVHPKGNSNDDDVLRSFAKEVQTVAPHATGAPVATTSSSYT
ncbi:hypothetical protein, partial [Klebsiella pneumoniae]